MLSFSFHLCIEGPELMEKSINLLTEYRGGGGGLRVLKHPLKIIFVLVHAFGYGFYIGHGHWAILPQHFMFGFELGTIDVCLSHYPFPYLVNQQRFQARGVPYFLSHFCKSLHSRTLGYHGVLPYIVIPFEVEKY